MSIDITFSSKNLVPFVSISYLNKAPAFANIDNLEQKLEKHFGKIYLKPEEYQLVVKREEVDFKPFGDRIKEIEIQCQVVEIFKVGLDDAEFQSKHFYLQAILPFFINGASVIEPSPFWKYFMIYDK